MATSFADETSFADIYTYIYMYIFIERGREKKGKGKGKILNATNLEYTGPDTCVFSDGG